MNEIAASMRSQGLEGFLSAPEPELRVNGGSFYISGNFCDAADNPEFYARSMAIDPSR